MWRILFGKYKEIVAAIAIFIVLDAGVLLLNFYTTYQISDDAHAIRLASRQEALTQRIFYSVTQVRDDLIRFRNFEHHQSQLAISFKQFDEGLDAFIYGGQLIGQGQGQDGLLVSKTYQSLSQEHLKKAETLWKTYRKMISGLVYAEYYDEELDNAELIHQSDMAIQYARDHGDALLESVTSFSQAVENKAHKKAVRLRVVQAIAIVFAIINFFVILFHFIKRLNSSDEKAAQATEETAEILRTVNDGLFLLGADYKIGSQCSASMATLFRQDNFSGQYLLDILSPLVDAQTLETTKDYVDSLFNERVKSYLMDELNPLQEVEITVDDRHSSGKHFFSFHFSRVYKEGQIVHLLVSVKDVTENVKLKEGVKNSEYRAHQEVDSLLALMKVDGGLLKDFMRFLEGYLSAINDELERSAYDQGALLKKLDKIGRIAHTIKGEASMLNLTLIESKVHALEDRLGELKFKKTLEGDDFLSVTMALNDLVNAADSIKLVSSRLPDSVSSQQLMAEPQNSESPLQAALQGLADKISASCHKQVVLDFSRFNMGLIPSRSMPAMRNVLIQLIRNAIVHGLEKPEKRKKLGKHPIGTISIVVEEVNESVVLSVRDDGRGINFSAIRSYLLESGKYQAGQVESMKRRELVKCIFSPGFSTSKHVDHHAGRGVGLDVVKEQLNNLGASLSVSCKAKQSSKFTVCLPIVKPEPISASMESMLEAV